jgi:DNA-binding Lrp family transcriptional regulator
MSDRAASLDEMDRRIINALQGGFPVSEHPFAEAAAPLGISEDELIRRVDHLVSAGVLSRFGPLYNAERLGGAVTLAAISVPEAEFERVAALVNARPEVAHNYAREHRLNMWFVVAADRPERIAEVLALIEAETGFPVLDMPKMQEFFIGLRIAA